MIELIINGKTVKLKDFPSRALESTIMGFLKTLTLQEIPKNITIHIKDATDKDKP